MTCEEPLGFHGVVVRSARPAEDARRWRRLLSLPVLRKAAGEITLGRGPELFVTLRRLRRGEEEGIVELHLAVRKLRAADAAEDELGGRSVARSLSGLTLVVREFAGPPGPGWHRGTAPAGSARRSRRAGTARGRSSRRDSR